MSTVAKVVKNKNENSMNLLRRFRKAVRNADFTQLVKSRRYYSRKASDLRRKDSALVRIEKGKEFQRLFKLGRLPTKN